MGFSIMTIVEWFEMFFFLLVGIPVFLREANSTSSPVVCVVCQTRIKQQVRQRTLRFLRSKAVVKCVVKL